MVLLFFAALQILGVLLSGRLESLCISTKHHSSWKKKKKERSWQRIKALGGCIWQIAAVVLPVDYLFMSLFSQCGHRFVAPPRTASLIIDHEKNSAVTTTSSHEQMPFYYNVRVCAHIQGTGFIQILILMAFHTTSFDMANNSPTFVLRPADFVIKTTSAGMQEL